MSEITEFKYFPRLPPELGLLVWSEVIDNDPRVIEVSGGHVANPRLPALMLACKESAAEMRKRYHKKLTKGFFFSARNIDVTSKRRGCLLFPHTDIILIPVQDSVFSRLFYPSKKRSRYMPRVTEYGIKRIASPGLHVIQDILRWHKDGKDSCPANYWTWLDSVEELFLMADTRSPITAHWRRFHGQRPDVSSQGSQSNLRYWGFEQVK